MQSCTGAYGKQNSPAQCRGRDGRHGFNTPWTLVPPVEHHVHLLTQPLPQSYIYPLSQRRKPRLSKDVKLFFKKTKRRAFISHGSEGRRSPRSRCWQIPKPPSCEEAQVGLVRSAGVPGPERPRPLPLPCILSSPFTEHATSVEGSRAHHCPTNAVLCRWESPQHGAWPRAGAR